MLIENMSIFLNNEMEIDYCNQDKKNCIKIIDELKIKEFINSGNIGTIFYNNYFIDINKFVLGKEHIYHILIEKYISEDSYLPNTQYIDNQSGLYNRILLENINVEIVKAIFSRVYSLIVIDIVNKREDYDIKIVSKSIKDYLRKEDIPIRYDENRFLIILPDAKKETVEKSVEEIKEAIEKSNLSEGFKINISIRILAEDNIDYLKKYN